MSCLAALARPLRKLLAPVLLGWMCALSWASPDAAAQAELDRLLKEGKTRQALEWVEQRLAANPDQPALILIKGVLLAESQRNEDAKQVFQDLILKYPQLPEPYNNLAVIYAREGDLTKARATLELAIKSNPAYAIAYENLGDIYARLANESYARALNLQPGGNSVSPKLRLIRQVVSLTHGSPQVTEAPSASRMSESVPAVATAASPAGTRPATPPEPEKNTVRPTGVASPEQEAVLQAVERWRAAWASRDMDAYVAAYVPNYVPADATGGHAAWVQERRRRIADKSRIEVELDGIDVVTMSPDEAVVRFRQRYRAPGLRSTTRKELRLRLVGGQWRIAAERTLR